VIADCGGQVNLGDDRHIRGIENRRIFQRLVFAFGHGDERQPQLFAQVV